MKKQLIYSLLLLTISSCDLPQEKPADVTEAKEVKEIDEQESVNIKKYSISTDDSEVKWTGSKPTGKHYGTFGIKEGSINIIKDSIAGGKIIINMEDIHVEDLRSDEDSQMKLTEHLKSADFFDVENHPVSIFEITSVKKINATAAEKSQYDYEEKNDPSKSPLEKAKPPTHEISGNLTLRGKTLGVSFPAYIEITSEHLLAEAAFSIDRTLWDVKHREEAEFKEKAQDKMIYNNVVIGLDIVAYPQKDIL